MSSDINRNRIPPTIGKEMPPPAPTGELQRQSTLYNVSNLGKFPYVAAKKRHISNSYRLTTNLVMLFKLTAMTVICVPWMIKDLLHFVVPRSLKSVRGQLALVTGAGNGIGRQIALRLAREGCRVAVADLDVEAAASTVEECRSLNVEAQAFACDFASSTEVRALQQTIRSKMGGTVDILVNNVGIMTVQSMREVSDEDLDRITKLNLLSHVYTLRTFLPDMIANRRGHIIGMSSLSGLYPTPRGALYSATKYGVLGLNESMRAELRQEGLGDCIHFTTVHPYFVSTRQDLMEAFKLRYPPVSPAKVADDSVDAMLGDVSAISVPRNMFWLATLFRVMPEKWQCYFRDYFLEEHTAVVEHGVGK